MATKRGCKKRGLRAPSKRGGKCGKKRRSELVLKGARNKVSQVLLGEREGKKRGLIPTAIMGVGLEAGLRAADNIVGGPIQRLFSVNAPFVGTIGPLDAIVFLIMSNGFKNLRGGATAVLGAKIILGGALAAVSPINIGTRGINLSQQSSTAAGQSGGPV